MPDLFGYERATESWTTSGSCDSVLAKLISTGEIYDGKLASTEDGSVQMHFGSRAALRTLGPLSPISVRPVLLRLTTAQTVPEEVLVTVEAFCDPGWYATGIGTKRLFRKAFRRLFDALQKSTPSLSPD